MYITPVKGRPQYGGIIAGADDGGAQHGSDAVDGAGAKRHGAMDAELLLVSIVQ